MADLSDMLGDVYGDDADGERVAPEPPAQPGDGAQAAPAWADESVLDAAFANWTPGPPLDAPAAERDVFAPHVDPASAAPLPDDLAAALSAALVGAPPGDVAVIAAPALSDPGSAADRTRPPPTSDSADPFGGGASWAELAATRRASADYEDPFAASMPLVGRLPWQRGDDDILPRRSSSSRRGRGGLNLRRK